MVAAVTPWTLGTWTRRLLEVTDGLPEQLFRLNRPRDPTRSALMDNPHQDLHAALRAIHGGDLCRPCLWVLPVTGAAVAAVNDPMNSRTCHATDPVAARLDEIQFDLGEGPLWSAFTAGRPVLVPNLSRCPADDWPVFAAAVRPVPAAAVFVFPLRIGQTRVGVLSLYRETPGPLGPEGVIAAWSLAGTMARELANRILSPAPDCALLDSGWSFDRGPIFTATGITMTQLRSTAPVAFARLQAHAFSAGITVAAAARQVISEELRLPL